MPRGDGTGPRGQGPGTGRGMGKRRRPGPRRKWGKGEEVVLAPARADIAFARTAGKEQPIRWGAPVTNRNVPSVERP